MLYKYCYHTRAVPLFCRQTLLLCLHTPVRGTPLLADGGCPAAAPSSFPRTTQKPLHPVHPDSPTISTQAPQRSVDTVMETLWTV